MPSSPRSFAGSPSPPLVRITVHPVLTICVILTAPPSVSREVTKDDHYGGHLIPKGAQIMANNWAISRDEEQYPEPEAFRPERFLDAAGKALRTDILHPMQYAFGFGHRTCPGRFLADALLFSHFAHVLKAFDVALPLGAEALKADRQMKIKSNGAACRVDEVYVTLAPRSPAASALFGLAAPPSAGHNGAANGNAAH